MDRADKEKNTDNIRLLSLDGGGIRGLSSLIILKYLLEQVSPRNPPKPCEYFQLIGGTSTGGLIALMLGRLHGGVDECIEKCMVLSSAAFSVKRTKIDIRGRVKDKWKASGKYSYESLAGEFKAAAELLVGDADAPLLEENGICKVFVCANSKAFTRPVLMRSYVANQALQIMSLANCRIYDSGLHELRWSALSWAAMRGNMNATMELLETPNIDVNSADCLGRTAVSWAAFKGHGEIVKLLLRHSGVDSSRVDNDGMAWQALAKGLGANTQMASLFHESETRGDGKFTGERGLKVYAHEAVSAHEWIDEVWDVEFSHDGRRVAICGSGSAVDIWDIQSSVVAAKLRHGDESVAPASWSPDDSLVVTCGSQDVRLWSVEGQRLVQVVKKFDERPDSCAWSARGDWFIVGAVTKRHPIWQQFPNGPGFPWLEHDQRVEHAILSRDEKKLLVIGRGNTTYIYGTATRTLRIGANSTPVFITTSRDEQHCITGHSNGTVLMSDMSTYEQVREFTGLVCDEYKLRSCFGGVNESLVLSGSEDGCVMVWERDTGTRVTRIEAHPPICNCVAWSPVDPHLFVSGGDDHTFKFWRMQVHDGEQNM